MMGWIYVHFDMVVNLPSLFLRRIWKGGICRLRSSSSSPLLFIWSNNNTQFPDDCGEHRLDASWGVETILSAYLASFTFVTLEMKIAWLKNEQSTINCWWIELWHDKTIIAFLFYNKFSIMIGLGSNSEVWASSFMVWVLVWVPSIFLVMTESGRYNDPSSFAGQPPKLTFGFGRNESIADKEDASPLLPDPNYWSVNTIY